MKSLWGQGNKYLRVKRRGIDISPKAVRILLVTALILVGAIFIAGDVGLWNLWTAQKQMKRLESQIIDLEKENELLRAEIIQLRCSTFAVEKVARERYGYLKPGDKVYRIITLPADDENAGAAPTSLDIRSKNP